MRYMLVLLILTVCLVSGVRVQSRAQPVDVELSISPVVQRTPVWCWVAVGEMVFDHFGVPNVNPVGVYQCGIIGALAGPMHPCWGDCTRCVVPAGNSQNITNMLLQYPRIAGQLTRQPIRGVRSYHAARALTVDEIKQELDEDRPIIAGINPGGITGPSAQHVALIIGYEENENGVLLIVNDPYPYQFVGNRFDPYLRAQGQGGNGQYRVAYDNFRRGLGWTESFYELRQ